MNIIIFSVIFFSTCFFDSFLGFQGISIYPVLILVLAIPVMNTSFVQLDRNDFIFLSIIFFVIIISLCLMWLKFGVSIEIFKSYLTVLIGIVVFRLFYNVYNKSASKYKIKALNIILVFHMVILAAQLLTFYVFDVDFDVGKLLLGEGHRPFGSEQQYRPTGVFDEPGIYSIFIFSLFVIRYLLNGKLYFFDVVILISIILTNSLYGILLISLFLIWLAVYGLKNNKIYKYLMLGALSTGAVVVAAFAAPRLVNVFSGRDPSTLSKTDFISNFLGNDLNLLTGLGLLPVQYWPDMSFQASGDLTFFISTLLIYGIPLGLLLIVCTYF